MNIKEVSPKIAANLRTEGWFLLDVRAPGEWNALHATDAVNLPLDSLTEQKLTELCGNSRRILTICHSGGRSKRASEQIAQWPSFEVASVEGGTSAWNEAGLPVVKGKGSISIERQVRIIAGALVALGVIAGMFISPNALYLPLFVGCGLVFAGITDFCGMGILLSKMPWNQ